VDNRIMHLGTNESNYFLYQSGGPVRSPLPLTLHVHAGALKGSLGWFLNSTHNDVRLIHGKWTYISN